MMKDLLTDVSDVKIIDIDEAQHLVYVDGKLVAHRMQELDSSVHPIEEENAWFTCVVCEVVFRLPRSYRLN